MKDFFTLLKTRDKFITLPIFFSALTITLMMIFFPFLYSKLPPRLPLFYSLPWGESQLVSREQFLLLPLSLLLIVLTNYFFASQLHPGQIVLKRMLLSSLAVVNLIMTFTIIKIVSIFI